ncbi:hypothetical protein I5677_12300 [Mobilitalea sibirica]|uniref:Uncharacterized protein n=1 Tax=Mobilitalea sibirica TaxID=1462919 RepID=A0A8J7HB00_9FIRM|nr:hypothetical protein [Mobilitalea sibirica]MBH1941675.1 hypothetical protein [Mobilitalea sibirica]
MRVKKCVYCRQVWGISIHQCIPRSGYECPRCTGKRKRAQLSANQQRPKAKLI